jgi:hypothetical protein
VIIPINLFRLNIKINSIIYYIRNVIDISLSIWHRSLQQDTNIHDEENLVCLQVAEHSGETDLQIR